MGQPGELIQTDDPGLLAQQLAATRQQLRHYQDAALQQQRAMWGGCEPGYTSAFGGVLGGVQWHRLDPYRPDPETEAKQAAALTRALDLLEVKIGAPALAKIQAGGAYRVASKWWPNIHYLVPKTAHERIKVIADGSVVTESCLVTTDPSLPWPDVMLQRISALEIDESVLFATGVLHDRRGKSWREKIRRLFR